MREDCEADGVMGFADDGRKRRGVVIRVVRCGFQAEFMTGFRLGTGSMIQRRTGWVRA